MSDVCSSASARWNPSNGPQLRRGARRYLTYTPGSLKDAYACKARASCMSIAMRVQSPTSSAARRSWPETPLSCKRLDELERRGAQPRTGPGAPGRARHPRAGAPRWASPACIPRSTGIVSFPAVARAYAQDDLSGGSVVGGCEAQPVSAGPRTVRLEHSQGATEAGHAILRRRLGRIAGGQSRCGPRSRSCPSAAPTCAWRPERRELAAPSSYTPCPTLRSLS